MEREIEKLARNFINLAWNKGQLNLLRQYCTPGFHYHTTFNEQVLGIDGYTAYVETFRRCMPDLVLTIEDVMVKDDKAIVHSILSGTIEQSFFGLPASDKLITFSAMSTLEVYNDKVNSLDSMIDIAGIQRQLVTPIAMDYPLGIK